MKYTYVFLYIFIGTTPTLPMFKPLTQFTSLKKILDETADSKKNIYYIPSYNAVLTISDYITTFLNKNPEYAQQIVEIIYAKIKDSGATPVDKTIIRIMHHEQYFLGEKVQEDLIELIEFFKSENKKL